MVSQVISLERRWSHLASADSHHVIPTLLYPRIVISSPWMPYLPMPCYFESYKRPYLASACLLPLRVMASQVISLKGRWSQLPSVDSHHVLPILFYFTHCDNLHRNDLPTYVLLFWISHETIVNFYMPTSFEGYGFSGHIPQRTLVPITLRRLSSCFTNIILLTHCDNLHRNDLPTYVLLFWIPHETIVS